MSFYGSENPRLTDELLIEPPPIFNWALEGLDRLNERGYFVNPQSGVEAIQQLEDLSSPISAFIRDTCDIGRNRVESETLWAAWKTWCEGDNRRPGTKAVFGRDLRAAVPTVKRVRPRSDETRPYVYEGIGLRDNSRTRNGKPLGPPGPGPDDDDAGPSGPRSTPMYSGPEVPDDTGD